MLRHLNHEVFAQKRWSLLDTSFDFHAARELSSQVASRRSSWSSVRRLFEAVGGALRRHDGSCEAWRKGRQVQAFSRLGLLSDWPRLPCCLGPLWHVRLLNLISVLQEAHYRMLTGLLNHGEDLLQRPAQETNTHTHTHCAAHDMHP